MAKREFDLDLELPDDINAWFIDQLQTKRLKLLKDPNLGHLQQRIDELSREMFGDRWVNGHVEGFRYNLATLASYHAGTHWAESIVHLQLPSWLFFNLLRQNIHTITEFKIWEREGRHRM